MSKVKVKLKLHHSLKDLSNEQQIVNLIVEGVNEQFQGTNLKVMKNNLQLITNVMNCVENISTSKSLKKKDIVLKVFHELFDSDTEHPLDLDLLEDSIEYVIRNSILTKYTMVSKVFKVLFNVFLKK